MGWDDFRTVQPLQLSGARQRLRAEGLIEEDTSAHDPPVTMLRLPYQTGTKRFVQREAGRRRKVYRKYLSWARDQQLCGKHAERVVLESMVTGTPAAGIWVPEQIVGEVDTVGGKAVGRGPLDAYAHILGLDSVPVATEAYLTVEVKNIHKWIYPWAPELWELLVKAATLAEQGVPVMPVLACMRGTWQTAQMAKDIGFLVCQLNAQLFSPAVDAKAFRVVQAEFELSIDRHEGPHVNVLAFLSRTLRLSPPPSEPTGEETPWYRRQVERFAEVAPIVLNHDALAGVLHDDARRRVFRSFRARAKDVFTWPSAGGW